MTDPAPLLQLNQVQAGYGRRAVLHDVTLSFEPGGMTGVIGPNGAGKTTLLRVIAGDLRPQQGGLEWKGTGMAKWSRAMRARAMAYVPPSLELVMPLSVREYVALGRTPYRAAWQPMGAGDRTAVAQALAATQLENLADRSMATLSEGERHRALLALGLAQQPQLLLLDEPTAHLDLRHAWRFMELVHQLQARTELTVVWTSHDLNMAAAFCERVVALSNGRVDAVGAPSEMLTSSRLTRIYEHPIAVTQEPGQPLRVFPQRLPMRPDRDA